MADLFETGPVARRTLLKGAAAGVGLTVLGGGTTALVDTAQAESNDKKPTTITGIINIGPATDFAAGTVSTKFMVVNGIAISNDGGTITAIRPKCTHRGCIAKWNADKNFFQCPCHGARFDIQGQPTKGPATKPLARIPTTANADGTLSVDLDKLYALAPEGKK